MAKNYIVRLNLKLNENGFHDANEGISKKRR